MQKSALCRSRQKLSNIYLLATFGFDTAENESVALPATLEISDTPARSGVVSRAAARLRIELIPELGDPASLGSLLERRAQHPNVSKRYYCTLGSQP